MNLHELIFSYSYCMKEDNVFSRAYGKLRIKFYHLKDLEGLLETIDHSFLVHISFKAAYKKGGKEPVMFDLTAFTCFHTDWVSNSHMGLKETVGFAHVDAHVTDVMVTWIGSVMQKTCQDMIWTARIATIAATEDGRQSIEAGWQGSIVQQGFPPGWHQQHCTHYTSQITVLCLA